AGLLAEEASGRRLQPCLVLPAGTALIVVVGLFTTMGGKTEAQFTIPLVVALAVAGFVLAAGRRRRPPRPGAAAAAAFGAYLVYGAPVIATGKATFTGYVKLDDTATFLGFTDQIMSHGRDLAGLAPSTYQVMLQLNIG